jgi:hypothetical protein
LQGLAADVGVDASVCVQEPHLELVIDVVDAGLAAGGGDGGSLLAEAADRAAERDQPVVGLDGDLVVERKPRVA